jgi:hypothetical protein
MPPVLKTGQYQHLGPELTAAAMMESTTPAGVAGRETAPLLQVYGGPVTNVMFDDGVHILNNIC